MHTWSYYQGLRRMVQHHFTEFPDDPCVDVYLDKDELILLIYYSAEEEDRLRENEPIYAFYTAASPQNFRPWATRSAVCHIDDRQRIHAGQISPHWADDWTLHEYFVTFWNNTKTLSQ